LIIHGFVDISHYQNIYINLFNSIKKAIINRPLEEGIKLSPSRVLAQDFKISRSTVFKAYDLLVLEKYVKSIPGSGYYVASTKNLNHYKH